MVFWILGIAIIFSIIGFTFLYKLATKENVNTIDPKPKDTEL